jgi:hypothetical protein
MMELNIDDMNTTVRDVKQAQAELANAMKEYIDAAIEYRLAQAISSHETGLHGDDDGYSSQTERLGFEKAEAKLKAIQSR